jgi:hypothetical protein
LQSVRVSTPKSIRAFFRLSTIGLLALVMAGSVLPCSAQAPDTFRWIDFHSPQDQDVVVWVTRALDGEKWTAIREIGVEYDAALVITSLRPTPQSPANLDTYAVWSVSLSNRALTPILTGAKLRLIDWLLFVTGDPRELGVLYDDCGDCEPTTYFTALHYDLKQRTWAARWMHGRQAITLSNATSAPGVAHTQVYAAMADPSGREILGTWNHFDYGKQKPPEDYVYRYDIDQMTGMERTQQLSGKDADAMRQRLCRAPEAVPVLTHGQDSPLCPQGQKARTEHKPATSPPANNEGQSFPSGARH